MAHLIKYTDVDILRQDIRVLKRVNLAVDPGEFIYITGKVGSGKSSLLKTMYAEEPVAAGTAEVMGYDLGNIKSAEIPFLRRQVGIVFQDFRLLNDRNIYENLKFVLDATGWKDKNSMKERFETTLRQMGMLNKGYKLPYELSGGDQQRGVIARAMLKDPQLLIADEPTGNLDPVTAAQIMKRLQEIQQQGTTVIVATHNLGLIDQFPGRVLKCADRSISE